MTFIRKYYLGYLVFVMALVLVYLLVPHEYGLVALLVLAAGFALYQRVILPKKGRDQQV
ncbi:hypothetical protein [Rossellomorea marisflavi]|uniref:hypothetical protein n=1 Tax=Rossellomorea marisflavi TaxID=189381 RepID=UPI0034575A5C